MERNFVFLTCTNDDEETDDEFVHGDEQVNDDEDEEMTNAEVEESGNGNEEVTDAAKVDAGKTEEVKDDAKKAELPLTRSSLSVSLGFGDQFLKLLSDTSLIGTIKDTIDAEINSLLDIKIQYEVLHIQSPSALTVPVLVITKPLVLTPIPETPLVAPATTLLPPPSVSTIPPVPLRTTTPIPAPPIITEAPTITTVVPESDALAAVQLRVAKLEKDVSELKKMDHSAGALATVKSQVPTVIEHYIGSKIGDDLQKSPSEILKIKKEQVEKQKMPKYTIKSTDKASLKEYDLKSALYQTMNENKSFNRNPANHALYHALMEALIEDENDMDKGVTDTVKNHKRQHDDDEDDDEDPSVGPNQGKKTKMRRTNKLESSMKPSTTKETSKGKALTKNSKTGKSATAQVPIDEPIAEVVMDDQETNENEDVVNDVDRTCTSSIELEYNMEERFKALIDRLDWNNLEGDRCPFDLTKPLPLKGRPGHLTVAAEYFFNKDLEFLKSSDPEKKYTTSITESKAARYEIIGIEDIVPTLWSTTKVRYDKDAEKGIKHWGERRKLCVSVKKLHRYVHLEEITVRRADRRIYKFKEGNFVDLHLNDIEDMLLLAVQHKLFQLDGSDIVDLIAALRMFTRSLTIKRRVEDLQLGVESYQKKLNITAPQKTFPEIEFKELYTPSYKPPGTIRDELHHRILDFHLGYNEEMSRRKWTATKKKRSALMVKLIDKQMCERRIIRNLERLVGARELEMDYKPMTQTD
ncbi:hypothetical protein Tco_1266634 [Tanacetum coccineum]